MGLAADAAPEILSNLRLPAERLEFAGREEGCPHLLASDDHSYQGADQHPAFDPGHRRILAALDYHHSLISTAWNFSPIISPISACFADTAPARNGRGGMRLVPNSWKSAFLLFDPT